MKVTAILATLMAAAAVSASAAPGIQARDTCGAGYGGDQRRTNSPCQASNGDRRFCGCDRTGVVQCQGGTWTEIQDCGSGTCHGTNDGGAVC
ncbi:putative bubble protein precursor protein [Rosellinia necatrix]|uniref:Putative bubble protein protein n=1 Tax=Rosellinia necatrix TaxID=77044 RepID=A0A1W2TV93_ROSNE|nr:putative bubble protein precursor protein [Rosellinia necatrix]